MDAFSIRSDDGMPPFLMAVDIHGSSADRDMEFLVGDTPTPIDGKYRVPIEQVRETIVEFVTTGKKSGGVRWVDLDANDKLSDTNHEWPFLDPPNTAVFTNIRILDGEDWVQYVTHDEEDGAWQFHPSSGQASMQEVAVTSLQRIVAIEPRIAELADLALGWHAWRDSKDADWMSAPKKP